MNAQIRRLENTLTTIGTGIIAMSVWQLIKNILQYTLLRSDDESELSLNRILFMIGVLIIFSLIDCYIGFSARSEGKGKKKKGIYLFWTALYLIVSFIAITLELILVFIDPDYTVYYLIVVIIDITVLVLNIEMMVSAIKVRRLRKLNTL